MFWSYHSKYVSPFIYFIRHYFNFPSRTNYKSSIQTYFYLVTGWFRLVDNCYSLILIIIVTSCQWLLRLDCYVASCRWLYTVWYWLLRPVTNIYIFSYSLLLDCTSCWWLLQLVTRWFRLVSDCYGLITDCYVLLVDDYAFTMYWYQTPIIIASYM